MAEYISGPNQNQVGSLCLYLGPVRGSKSDSLGRSLVQLYDGGGLKCLYINHLDARRGSNKKSQTSEAETDDAFETHSSLVMKLPPGIDQRLVIHLDEIDVTKYQVIGVDEAGFFCERDMHTIIRWKEQGKHIFVAALNGDFMADLFGSTALLIPHAVIQSCAGICVQCKAKGLVVPAMYSMKLAGDLGVRKESGGPERYGPACYKCWLEWRNQLRLIAAKAQT